jgi:hypothetical protein
MKEIPKLEINSDLYEGPKLCKGCSEGDGHVLRAQEFPRAFFIILEGL